jgi:hypothetical protein
LQRSNEQARHANKPTAHRHYRRDDQESSTPIACTRGRLTSASWEHTWVTQVGCAERPHEAACTGITAYACHPYLCAPGRGRQPAAGHPALTPLSSLRPAASTSVTRENGSNSRP